ncbi:hypothetical protein [Streptomyces broussonetiae]|uniref:hypothetical protein n=1 Tax=Streptomyces broussonetiae TaxID=2686304 RepID=UPI0035D70349
MITSDNALLYSYTIWLTGRHDSGLTVDELRPVIGRVAGRCRRVWLLVRQLLDSSLSAPTATTVRVRFPKIVLTALPHQDAAVSTELLDGLVLDGLRYGRSRACAGDGP